MTPPAAVSSVDVVIVGGGIGGAALATVLARVGLDVTLLEREPHYRDRVRGEIFVSWGVAELKQLGLDTALLGTDGAGYTTRGVLYDEIMPPGTGPADAASLADLLPGIPGHLAIGHPQACAALAREAAAAGARVLLGVEGVQVTVGPRPSVRFQAGGRATLARARLVVGSDGRGSTVRRQLGLPLTVERSGTTGSGLLVRQQHGWPLDQLAVGTEGDRHFQVFPRPDGHLRLYLYHDEAQRRRFSGPGGTDRFLQSFAVRSIPDHDRLTGASPAGPCRSYAMSSSWAARPAVPGVVLVGDAAGWSDPIIGQGLSIAARDARLVAEALLGTEDWGDPDCFAAYAAERRERMRRLRMSSRLRTAIHCTFTREGIARRRRWYGMWHEEDVLGGLERAVLIGPERVPDQSFTAAALSEVLAIAG